MKVRACCTKLREEGKLAQIHEFQMGRGESPRNPFRGSFPHVWNIVDQTGLLRYARRRAKEIAVEAETKAMLKFVQYHAPTTHLITILALGHALSRCRQPGEMQLNVARSRSLFRLALFECRRSGVPLVSGCLN